MPPLDSNWSLVSFAAGALCMFLAAALWHAARFYIDLRVTRARVRQIENSLPRDELASQAWKRVSACRRRLRYNPNPNPEWIAPLIEEIPRLVREIAAIYYPEHPEPAQAPRVSEFARAVQFIATDIAELLQSRRMGRLIDVSAGRSVRAFKTSQRVWTDPRVRRARAWIDPIYKVGKPIWQMLSYNSPFTWISMGASNAAVRTIHPAIVTIVARRAIDLYSGRLSERSGREAATIADALSRMGRAPEPETPPGRLARSVRALRRRLGMKSGIDRGDGGRV
jgi:hypothetical protein